MESIKYSGQVNIKLVRNGVVIKEYSQHNSGLSSLFSYLCYCLLSDYNSNNAPKYIKLCHVESDTITDRTTAIPISEKKVTPFGSNYRAQFQFTIPGVLIGNKTRQVVELYSQNNVSSDGNGLATTELQNEIPASTSDTTVYLEWEMYFSN